MIGDSAVTWTFSRSAADLHARRRPSGSVRAGAGCSRPCGSGSRTGRRSPRKCRAAAPETDRRRCASVTALATPTRAGLRASTVTPGSTAPDVSLTTPSIDPRVSCATAPAGQRQQHEREHANEAQHFASFLLLKDQRQRSCRKTGRDPDGSGILVARTAGVNRRFCGTGTFIVGLVGQNWPFAGSSNEKGRRP